MLPVIFSPSTLKVNVVGAVSPLRPGMSPVHFPEMSAAIAKVSNSPREQAILIIVFILIPFHLAGLLTYATHCTRSGLAVRSATVRCWKNAVALPPHLRHARQTAAACVSRNSACGKVAASLSATLA